MNIKSKIINYTFENNTIDLYKENYNDEGKFYLYILEVIDNSHPFVRFSFKITIFIILIIYFFLFLFLLDNKTEKKILKYILRKIEKIVFFNKIFKLIKIYSIIYYYD